MDELVEIGRKAVNHAQGLGLDEAEIFLYKENQTTVKFAGGIFASRGGAVKGLKRRFARIAEPWIKKKGLPVVTSGVRAGVGVRAVEKKAIGFTSVSSIEEKNVLEVVEQAAKIAKIRPPDPNWVSLPEAKKPLGAGGIFDERVQELDAEKMLGLCADCCAAVGDFDKRITQAAAMISASSVYLAVVNTNGLESYDRGTTFTVSVDAKAKSGNEDVGGYDILSTRSFTNDLNPLAVSVAKRTVECLGRRALSEKHVGKVVFENTSWNALFSVIFPHGISALNVQENRSIYKGNVGNQVSGENVSIVDDGTLPDGFGTAKIDDEGTPRQRTPIVENGVLANIIYDNYAAKREQRESTGNASRLGRTSPPYANQPAIKPSNLVLLPGKGDLDELLSQVKNGVLVKGSPIGALHSNVITGDFSVTADTAFKIEDGRIAHPLKACTVAGNLYGALKSIVAIGGDSKAIGNVVCPSLIVDGIVAST